MENRTKDEAPNSVGDKSRADVERSSKGQNLQRAIEIANELLKRQEGTHDKAIVAAGIAEGLRGASASEVPYGPNFTSQREAWLFGYAEGERIKKG